MNRIDWSRVALLVGLSLIHSDASMNMDLWSSSCPFNNFCTMSNLSEFNDTDGTVKPCCSNCSCEKDCWVYNSCCPDVTHEKPASLQAATCSQLNIENNYTTTFYFATNHYRVFDVCPRDYDVTNQHIIDQCEERLSDNTSLADVVAVSDSYNRIYKNKYCALCHGVHDVQVWDIRLSSCRRDFNKNRLAVSQYTRVLLENCYMESVPPNNLVRSNSEAMLCGKSLTAYCPAKVGTEQLAVELIDGCLNGPDIQFLRYISGETSFYRYKNVFCYLCRLKVSTVTQKAIQTTCPAFGAVNVKTTFTSYSLFLDETITRRTKRKMASTPCNEAEFYDALKRTCIPLYCPSFTVLNYGECLSISTSVDRYFVLIRIQYEPMLEYAVSGDITQHDIPATNTFIRQLLLYYGLQACEATECHVNAFVEKNEHMLRYVLVELKFQIGEQCGFDQIIHAVRRRLSTYHKISIDVNNVTVPLTGKILFYRQFGENDNSLLTPYDRERYTSQLLFRKPSQPLFGAYIETGFFLCPYLTFDIQEYNTIINELHGDGSDRNVTEISESTRVMDGFYTLTRNSVAICVDTYVRLYDTNRGSPIVVAPFVYLVWVLAAAYLDAF